VPVAVLGASSYSCTEATWTQYLWDWIYAHIHAFESFDDATRLTIPDNLKSGVKKPLSLRAGVELHQWRTGYSFRCRRKGLKRINARRFSMVWGCAILRTQEKADKDA
jgi:transposase